MNSTTALFVDTWGWLTMRDRSESRHREIKTAFDRFIKSGSVRTPKSKSPQG